MPSFYFKHTSKNGHIDTNDANNDRLFARARGQLEAEQVMSLIASSVRGTQSVSDVLDTVVPGKSCRQNILKGGQAFGVDVYQSNNIRDIWSKPPRSCV